MKLAVIDDKECIGCNRCVDPCPVYAIIGAKNYLHGINDADCIGCDLCVPACPVDCISMIDINITDEEKKEKASRAKVNYIENVKRKAIKRQNTLPDLTNVVSIKNDLNTIIEFASSCKSGFKVYDSKSKE